ncbi:SYP42 [Symbiodinium natans]|uniref:SYP42 protein n=1 Tax=Symbiodinium natans TaxID=878477 RepID=A0A812KT98_9DINO|nr:SYP42 [Symbiodinium natans]
MKNRGKQLQEKASWKQQAAGWFFILFMCGIGFFSFLFSLSDIIIGNGVVALDAQDTAKLKKVLFGGDPWLIYCINDETVNQRLPQILEESGRSLWRSLGLSVGLLRCWDETSSGRSVAQRFKLSLKPPLSFVVANGNKPRLLQLTGISKVEDLERRIKPALKLETCLHSFATFSTDTVLSCALLLLRLLRLLLLLLLQQLLLLQLLLRLGVGVWLWA